MVSNKESLFQRIKRETAENQLYQKKASNFSWGVQILIFLVTLAALTALFTLRIGSPTNEVGLRSGENFNRPEKDIIADRTFPILKPLDEYQSERNEAAEKTPPVFEFDDTAEEKAKNFFDNYLTDLINSSALGVNRNEEVFSDEAMNSFLELGESERNDLIKQIERQTLAIFRKVYKNGYVNVPKDDISTETIIAVFPPNYEKPYSAENLTDYNSYRDELESKFEATLGEIGAKLAFDIASRIRIPNLNYNENLTAERKEASRENVARTEGVVRKGETIAAAGEQITDSHETILRSYYRAIALQSEQKLDLNRVLGSFGLSVVFYSLLIIYLIFLRKKIFFDNLQTSVLSFSLVLAGVFAWASLQIPTGYPIEYLIFLPALSMLIAIVFDSRTAFYATVVMALLIAGVRGAEYETAVAMTFAGSVAGYTVRDIQSRTQMFLSIFFTSAAFILAILSFNFFNSGEATTALYKIGISLINAGLSPLIAYGLLYLLERSSSVATDLKLQEYDTLNHPLLQKLNDIAPGTYQHTLSVATLAEKCALAIGANARLAKVGAYFHDIGKMAKPEYFAENQIDAQSKHDLIPPKKSAEAIKKHVLAGIKLAHDYKLPKRILDFIPMHHGTSLIKHFYAKAVEEAGDISKVDENDFRYPGPKPNSRETALLMICDASEALSRLPLDSKQLNEAVNKVIREKLDDRQFDESDITIRDLDLIKDALARSLAGSAHKRVKYKEIPKNEDSDSE